MKLDLYTSIGILIILIIIALIYWYGFSHETSTSISRFDQIKSNNAAVVNGQGLVQIKGKTLQKYLPAITFVPKSIRYWHGGNKMVAIDQLGAIYSAPMTVSSAKSNPSASFAFNKIYTPTGNDIAIAIAVCPSGMLYILTVDQNILTSDLSTPAAGGKLTINKSNIKLKSSGKSSSVQPPYGEFYSIEVFNDKLIGLSVDPNTDCICLWKLADLPQPLASPPTLYPVLLSSDLPLMSSLVVDNNYGILYGLVVVKYGKVQTSKLAVCDWSFGMDWRIIESYNNFSIGAIAFY